MKRNENASSVPRCATFVLRRHSISGREAVALAAVAALLVPLLMSAAGAFSLPSLLERGVESLIPRLADGQAPLQPAAAPSRSGALVGAALNARVVISGNSDGASRGGVSVASDESHPVTGSRGSRAASVKVPDVPQVPSPGGVSGSAPPAGGSAPATAGPSGGGSGGPGPGGSGPGGSGPGESGTPAVSVAVDGTTGSVTVDAGISPATGTATVSGSTSGVAVAGTVAGVSISADAAVPKEAGAAPTAAVALDASGVAVPAVTAAVGSVAVSTLTGLAPS
ncbi:MAG: hypothetical protein M3Q31_10900 [Actinomycetota bacterium]|nr:hypothetical protein [Actinomycetota bacterium]